MALADTRTGAVLRGLTEKQEYSTVVEYPELEVGAILRKKKGLCSLEGPWAGDKNDPLGS